MNRDEIGIMAFGFFCWTATLSFYLMLYLAATR